jgi:hypothetical protein
MTHDELINKINVLGHTSSWAALSAVVELHKPWNFGCSHCINIEGGYMSYPCPTIQAIEGEI